MTPPILPLELCDHIAAFVPDARTHRAWALVCRAFVPASRRALFAAVRIYSPRRIHSLLALLASPWATPTPFVRRLTLDECDAVWVTAALPRLAATGATRVRALEVRRWEAAGVGAAAFASVFAGLESLVITHAAFDSAAQLAGVLVALPALEHLSLQTLLWHGQAPPVRVVGGVLRRLRSLHLLGDWPKQDILEWLLLHECAAVASTVVTDIRRSEVASIGRYLETLGPSLECLSLSFKAGDDAELEFSRHVRLSRNIRLKKLSIEDVESDVWGANVSSFVTVLSQIASPALRRLLIGLSVFQEQELDMFDWAALDEILSRSHFSDIEAIDFTFQSQRASTDILLHSIHQRLPVCRSRGLIHCGPYRRKSAAIRDL